MLVTKQASWNPTRYSMFFYKKFNTGSWYLGMKSEGDTEVVTIGLPYATKLELMIDLKNQYDLRCAPIVPNYTDLYRRQRDVLVKLLDEVLRSAPNVQTLVLGEKIRTALLNLQLNDLGEIKS